MKINKPVVVQYNDVFFFKSETFIYNYVSRLKNYQPIYLAREYDNMDLFPLPSDDRYFVSAAPPRLFTWPWFYYIFVKRHLGIRACSENGFLKQRQVRLIHAHFGPQGYLALKIIKKCKIPLITNFYGYDISELAKQLVWIQRYQSLFKKGDLFLVEGDFMRAKLTKIGCPENKIAIQRIAIPLKKIPFNPRPAKKNEEKVIFVFAGRFCEKKGLIYALQALLKLKNIYSNFEFHIIGDGPLKPQIENFIEVNRLSDQVKLKGFLNYPDYIKEMQTADIYLHPSITADNGNSEGGAPTSILEAQALGMPIVSTLHADIPNVVVPDKSALLAKEKDVDAIYGHLVFLMENRKVWADMGRVGRQFVEKYHNIDNEVIELEKKYAQLINKLN